MNKSTVVVSLWALAGVAPSGAGMSQSAGVVALVQLLGALVWR